MDKHRKRYSIKMLGDIPDTMLPDGWIGVYHISGAIVYLHRETRVVTWSRPYKISTETSLRTHNIPLLSIPCLHQKLAIDRYLEKSNSTSTGTCPTLGSNGPSHTKLSKCEDNGNSKDIPVTLEDLLSVVEDGSSGCGSITDASKEGGLNEGKATTPAANTVCSVTAADSKRALGCNGNASSEPVMNCNDGTDVKLEVDASVNRHGNYNNNNSHDDFISSKNVAFSCGIHNTNNEDINNVKKNKIVIARDDENSNISIGKHDDSNGSNSNNNNCAKNSCISDDSSDDNNSSSDVNNHHNHNSSNNIDNDISSNNSQCTEGSFMLLDETFNDDESMGTTDNGDELNGEELLPRKRKDEPTPSRDNYSRKCKHSQTSNNEFHNDNGRENDLLCSCRQTGNISNPDEVTPTSMHEYLSEIFGFDVMSIEKFKGTVFSCKSHHQNSQSKEPAILLEKKFNIVGKTPGQILNEYCQWRKTTLPTFTQVKRHSHHKFKVELSIGNLRLGMGSGGNLKQARHNAALHTLNILDHTILNEDDPFAHVAIFDQIPVDDKEVLPKIEKLSMTGVKSMTGVMLPYKSLLHLLFRNFPADFTESDIEFTVEELNPVRQKYTIRYKDYGVTGFCENWQPVREMAAQVLIAVMYPLISNWGTVIRLVEGYIDATGNPDLPTKKLRLKRGSDSSESSRRKIKKEK